MKILVLSNDEMERSVIQQVVQHNGHETIMAGNSDEAMQILQEGSVRFVIVDRMTTDMDEKEFIKRIRDAQPPYYIYILLIATRVKDTDVTTPRGGADDYLHKPVVPLELKSRVFIGERMLGLGDNLVEARDTLEKGALFDPLTNTLNERAFLSLSRGELERSRRGQAPLSLVGLEINNFDEIAEQHGDNIANDVLVLVTQAIREKSRPYDGLGRSEDNIFLISLPGVIGQDAEKIALRIIKGIMNTNIALLDGTALNLDVSAGVVSCLRVTISTEMEILVERVKEALARRRQESTGQVHTIFL
jgi:two-component system chemotaxis response regulator CheY